MRYLVLFCALILSACDMPQTSKYPEVDVDMQVRQVSEHVYYVQGKAGIATTNKGFVSNAGFVVTDDGVIVFDALGTPSLANKLIGKIREITDKPIRRVIVSHYHADHIYGLQVFKEHGAQIYAPEDAIKYIESDYAEQRIQERRKSLSPWVNETTHIVQPDHFLNEDMKFSLGGIDFTVSMVGAAHSDGDLTLYVEQDRVLFSGDIIFEGRLAFLGDANTKHWLETLERIDTDEPVALIPGHGPAAGEPSQAVYQTLTYLTYLREKMGAAAANLQSFDEVYAETDWSDYKHLPAFEETNRRNAYQVFLSIEREQLSQE